MADYQIGLNIESQELEAVSLAISTALSKLTTQTEESGQSLSVLKPLTLEINTSVLALAGFSENIKGISAELTKLKTKLIEITAPPVTVTATTAKKAASAVVQKTAAETVVDSTLLSLVVKGSKEIALTAEQISVSAIDVKVTLPESVTVRGKVILPKDIDIKLITPKAVAAKTVAPVSVTSSQVGEVVSLKPIELSLKTKLQELVSAAVSVKEFELGSPFTAKVKSLVLAALSENKLEINIDSAIATLSATLQSQIVTSASGFDISPAIRQLSEKIVAATQGLAPTTETTVKTPKGIAVRGNVVIPPPVQVKVNTPKGIAVKGLVEIPDPIKVKVNTPKGIAVKGLVEIPDPIKVKVNTPKGIAVKTVEPITTSAQVSEVTTVKPIELSLKTKIQALVSEVVSVKEFQLGAPFTAKVKELVLAALAENKLTINLDDAIGTLSANLQSQIATAGVGFDIAPAVKQLSDRIIAAAQGAVPLPANVTTVKTPRGIAIKGAVAIPNPVQVKVRTPREIAVRGLVQIPEGIKVKVNTPKEIAVEGKLNEPSQIEIKVETDKEKIVKGNLTAEDVDLTVSPVNLRLQTKLQALISEALTVGEIKLGTSLAKAIETEIQKSLNDLGFSFDISAPIATLAEELSASVLESGTGFDLDAAIEQLNVKINALLAQASAKLEVTVPKGIAVRGLVQIPKSISVKVNIDKEISVDAVLKDVKSIEVELDTEKITAALSKNIVPVVIELEDVVSGKVTVSSFEIDLGLLLKDKITLINPAVAIDEVSLNLQTSLQTEVVKALSVESIVLGQPLADKVQSAILDAIELEGIKVDVSEEIQTFVQSFNGLQEKLLAAAAKLNTQLNLEGVDGSLIKDTVLGFLSAVADKLKIAFIANDLEGVAKVIKDQDAIATVDTDIDLLTQVNKFNLALDTEFLAAGNAFALSESILALNAKIKSEVDKSDFDFKTSVDLLNQKLANSFDSINFRVTSEQISLVDIAISSLFTKISEALNGIKTVQEPSGQAVGRFTEEKDLIERGNFARTIPLVNQARDAGEISGEKINGSTKEGKDRTLQVITKANLAIRALNGLEIEEVGKSVAEALANLVGELESVYDVVAPKAKEAIDQVSRLANEKAAQSTILQSKLDLERSSTFEPINLDGGIKGALRVRQPSENSRIKPNETAIQGGTPRDLREATKAIGKETEELAFDLRVLGKAVENGNTSVGKALESFATNVNDTAMILGITVEELSAIDPGALRRQLQDSLTNEGVKFSATEGLGFNQNEVSSTQAEANSGIGGMIEVLSSFTNNFVQAQLGNTTENQDAFRQFADAGRDFAGYTGQAGVEFAEATMQAGKAFYNNPATKQAAQQAAEVIRKSATVAADIYRSAQRVENATLGVFGIFGKAAKFGIQATVAQTTLGNLGLGEAGNFLGQGVSGLASAAGSLAKDSTDAFGSGVTIDVITNAIKAAAPLIGLGIATGIATKTIDQVIPDNDPKITALEEKIQAISVGAAEELKEKAKEKLAATTEIEALVEPKLISAEPVPVEVQKSPAVEQNEEKVIKKEAEQPKTITEKLEIVVEAIASTGGDGGKNKDNKKTATGDGGEAKRKTNFDGEKTNVDLGTGDFTEKAKQLRILLANLAAIAKESGSLKDVQKFRSTAAGGVIALREGRSTEDKTLRAEQDVAIKAQIARASLQAQSLAKGTVFDDAGFVRGQRKQFDKTITNANNDADNGKLTEARIKVNAAERTLKNDSTIGAGSIAGDLTQEIAKLRNKIDQKELQNKVDDLKNEIKEARLSGKADIQGLKTSATALKSFVLKGSTTAGESAALNIRGSIDKLERALNGVSTKDFSDALSIANSQQKLGDFTDARKTLNRADDLSQGDNQALKVDLAFKSLDTAKVTKVFDDLVLAISKADLAGATEESVAGLRKLAMALSDSPVLALKARKQIDALENKLPKNVVEKDSDKFKENLNRSKQKSSLGEFTASRDFLKLAENFAATPEETDKIKAQDKNIIEAELKKQIVAIDELINQLKVDGVNKDGLNTLRSQISQKITSPAEANKLNLKVNALDKPEKKINDFGLLFQSLKKEFTNLGIKPSIKDVDQLRGLVNTRAQSADVNGFLAKVAEVPIVKEVKQKNLFPDQLSLVNQQVRNGTDTSKSLPALQGLVKTKLEAEKVLGVLQQIEKIKLDDQFSAFKKKSEAVLNSGNDLKPSEIAFIRSNAASFTNTEQEPNANKILAKLENALDPFEKLAAEINSGLKRKVTPTTEQVSRLDRLAGTDTEVKKVNDIRSKSAEVSLDNDFNQFKNSIETFKNEGKQTREFFAEIQKLADDFKGTKFETKAQTESRKFSNAKDGRFEQERKLQQLNKTNKQPVNTDKLDTLAVTDTEKALVQKLKGALDKDLFDQLFKDFAQSLKKITNELEKGDLDLVSTFENIKTDLEVFQGTSLEINAQSEVRKLEASVQAKENRDFKSAKTTVSRGLEGGEGAIKFIEMLSTSSSKLAAQAKGFLDLQEASKQLKDFRDNILAVTQSLKRKEITAGQAQGSLDNIQSQFSNSSVSSNKAIATQLFNANSAVISSSTGVRNNKLTEANQLVKINKKDDAVAIYNELAGLSDSVGRQAIAALLRLGVVVEKLTTEEDNLLKLLNAEFNTLKSQAKVSQDLGGLGEFSNKVGEIPTEGSNLFKLKLDKLKADSQVAASPNDPKSAAEKVIKEDRSTKFNATDFLSSLQLLSGGFKNVIEGLKQLAISASVVSITLAKLDIANKGQVGQTAKDLTFAKEQQSSTGIAQQATLKDLAAFKLAIPAQDKLDSNGNRVTQAVGSPEIARILKGLQSAGTASQLTNEEQAGANNAVQQILSKGQVQSEELKRQLANFLPGTVSNFAESQGITTSELETRLKRGEVGIDALADFGDTLQKKFGKIAGQDTPVKAVNTLGGTLEDIKLKSAVVPGAGLQGALAIINPLLAGFKESASTLGVAGFGVGVLIVNSLKNELLSSIDKNGTLFKTSRKLIGSLVQNPEENIKGQLNPFDKSSPVRLSSLGVAAAKGIGGGLLSSGAVAVTKALGNESGGLDELITKAGKNVAIGLTKVGEALTNFLNKFGLGKEDNTTGDAKNQSKLLGDVFTQIIPATLLFSSAIDLLTGKVKKTAENLSPLRLPPGKEGGKLAKNYDPNDPFSPPSTSKATEVKTNPFTKAPDAVNGDSKKTEKPGEKFKSLLKGLTPKEGEERNNQGKKPPFVNPFKKANQDTVGTPEELFNAEFAESTTKKESKFKQFLRNLRKKKAAFIDAEILDVKETKKETDVKFPFGGFNGQTASAQNKKQKGQDPFSNSKNNTQQKEGKKQSLFKALLEKSKDEVFEADFVSEVNKGKTKKEKLKDLLNRLKRQRVAEVEVLDSKTIKQESTVKLPRKSRINDFFNRQQKEQENAEKAAQDVPRRTRTKKAVIKPRLQAGVVFDAEFTEEPKIKKRKSFKDFLNRIKKQKEEALDTEVLESKNIKQDTTFKSEKASKLNDFFSRQRKTKADNSDAPSEGETQRAPFKKRAKKSQQLLNSADIIDAEFTEEPKPKKKRSFKEFLNSLRKEKQEILNAEILDSKEIKRETTYRAPLRQRVSDFFTPKPKSAETQEAEEQLKQKTNVRKNKEETTIKAPLQFSFDNLFGGFKTKAEDVKKETTVKFPRQNFKEKAQEAVNNAKKFISGGEEIKQINNESKKETTVKFPIADRLNDFFSGKGFEKKEKPATEFKEQKRLNPGLVNPFEPLSSPEKVAPTKITDKIKDKISGAVSGVGAVASGALGLLANPIAAAVAPLVLALGVYALANTNFVSEFATESGKNTEELKRNTAELARKNGGKGSVGQFESTDKGAFDINKNTRDTNDYENVKSGNFGAISDFGITQNIIALEKAVKEGKTSSAKGLFGLNTIETSALPGLKKEQAKREKVDKDGVGTVSNSIFADPSFELVVQSMEALELSSKALQDNLEKGAAAALLTGDELKQANVIKDRLRTNEAKRVAELDKDPLTPEGNAQKASNLTDLESKISKDRKDLNELSTKRFKDAKANSSEAIKKSIEEEEKFFSDTEKGTPGFGRTNIAQGIRDAKLREREGFKKEDKKREQDRKNNDPVQRLTDAATVKENTDLFADKKLNSQQQALAKRDAASSLKRLSETNDRDKSVRDATTAVVGAKNEQAAIQSKLVAAENLKKEIGANPLGDEGLEKTKAVEAEIRALGLENEKKKGEIAMANLQSQIAIEAKAAEEADRKRQKQQRKIDTLEAKGQLANTADPSFQFNLNAVRQAETNAKLQERVAKSQVEDQSDVVKITKVNKEAAQDKLDDLKVVSIQKSAARQAATRARREAEEARLIELADINSNNRNRKLTNENNLATRIAPTFSGADAVINARLTQSNNLRTAKGATEDVANQASLLNQTRFGREQQSQKLEDLKSSKLQKDTELYLSTLAKIRAEYDLFAEQANRLANARNNVTSAANETKQLKNNQTFLSATATIKNDIAQTDVSARDNFAGQVKARQNFADQNAADKVTATTNLNLLNAKIGKEGGKNQFPAEIANDLSNITPAALAQRIANATDAANKLEAKKVNGDTSPVEVDGVFRSGSATAINSYREFLESFTDQTSRRQANVDNIQTLDKQATSASTARANTALVATEKINLDTKANDKKLVDDEVGFKDRSKVRREVFSTLKDNSAKSSSLLALSGFREAKAAKVREDDKLKSDSAGVVRNLFANQQQADKFNQPEEAKRIGEQITAEKANLSSKLKNNDTSAAENLVDNLLNGLKSLLGDELKLLNLREDVIAKERSLLELRKSLGLFKETAKEASTRDISNRVDDANLSVTKAKISLKNEQKPEDFINALSTAEKETKDNPKFNLAIREGLDLALSLQAQSGLTSDAMAKLKKALESIKITPLEKATAISLANARIDREKNINNNKSLGDLASSEDALAENQTTGRFSGIQNSSVFKTNKRNKAERDFRDSIDTINNDELNDTEKLTDTEKEIKFGTRRKIAVNTRLADLANIKSDAREIAEDIAGTITSNLKFDQFFKDILSGGNIGEAAAKIGESIFDGLANYFSQKAQKSLNDIIGGFFENLFDGIFGTIKDKAKEGSKTTIADLAKTTVTPNLEAIVAADKLNLSKVAEVAPLPKMPMSDSFKIPTALPESSSILNMPDSLDDDENFRQRLSPEAKTVFAPDVKRKDVSIFSPYHPDNQFGSTNAGDLTRSTIGVSQAEGDLSVVPDLGDNRPDVPLMIDNKTALEANTAALLQTTGEVMADGSITEGLTGTNLAEDEAFSKGLPSTTDSFNYLNNSLEGLANNVSATEEPLLGFGNQLLSVLSGATGGGSSGGGLFGMLSGFVGGLFGGGEGESGVGSAVLSSLPSFADGNIRSAQNMPKTPGGNDPRERGASSRLAVLNSSELVVPASLAKQFLDYSSGLSQERINESTNSTTNNNNSSNNDSRSYSTVNNLITGDTFGRSESAAAVISDKQNNNRKRFKTN